MMKSNDATGFMIPSLNGVRALAFGLVFLSHVGLENWVPGRFGVMVFFVLSGYLITTLMLREQQLTGRMAVGRFYLRRVLRLMPPLLVVLLLVALVHATGLSSQPYDPLAYVSFLAYFGNYYIIATEFSGVPLGTGVLWSLAVEEHFYLLYPLLFVSLIVPASRRRRLAILTALCVLALLWRVVLLTVFQASTLYLESATDARFDSLLFGCILAVGWNPMAADAHDPGLQRGLVLAAFCLVVLGLSFIVQDRWFAEVLRPTIHGVALAPLFYLAVLHARHWPYAVLNSGLLNYLGVISYSLYLCHDLIVRLLNEHLWTDYGHWLTAPIALLLAVAVSELIRRLVDQPLATVGRRWVGTSPPSVTDIGASEARAH